MNLETFIKNFSYQFDETDLDSFSAQTKFKDLDEWSSIMALSIIAMVDDEYNVKIKGEDIRSALTVEDMFNIVKSRV